MTPDDDGFRFALPILLLMDICDWGRQIRAELPLLPPGAILDLMDEDDPTDEIARIEARLEQLAEVAERCRKFILASKAAIAGGGALLLLLVLGLFGANETVAIGSIAAVLGGIVSLGSNVSTLRQTMAAISEAEAHRSDLIGMIDLQMVGDRTLKLI
jgi:hypothetical protein